MIYLDIIDEILATFSIDRFSDEAADMFYSFCRSVAIFRQLNPDATSGSGDLLRNWAKHLGRFYLEFDQWMKRGVLPLINADEEVLRHFGIDVKKRTVCAFAWSLAGLYIAAS